MNKTHADADPTREGQEPEAAQVLDDLNDLRSKAEERDKFLDLLQRTKADFDNYQKRMHRDLEQERKYAFTPLLKELLPALDNLERALSSVKEETTLSKGVAMVHTQLMEALKRQGVKAIEAEGQPFDPHLHQAVMQQPNPAVPPNTVLQVLQPGFVYHDRVIRPASVIVSKADG